MPKSATSTEKRHAALRDILTQQHVSKQNKLCALLRKRGFDVTQSSVSRDLQELGAAKIGGRYVLPEASAPHASATEPLLDAIRWVDRAVAAGPHMLVIHTPPGRASLVALTLDQAKWKTVAGTVAGDDTVFVATKNRADQVKVEARLADIKGKFDA